MNLRHVTTQEGDGLRVKVRILLPVCWVRVTAECALLQDGIFNKNVNNDQIHCIDALVGVSLCFQRRLCNDDFR